MPIDYSEYPAQWHAISAELRCRRAAGRCETCGAENGRPHPETGSRVVLTVAHINHDIQDIRHNPAHYDAGDADNNLVVECQRCHLWRDRRLHAHRRRYGRPTPMQKDLFADA